MFLLSKESHSHNQQHGKRKQNIALYSSATNNIHLLEFEDSCNPMEILGIGFSNTVHTISSFNIKMTIFCLTQRIIYPSLSVTVDNSRYIGQSRTGQAWAILYKYFPNHQQFPVRWFPKPDKLGLYLRDSYEFLFYESVKLPSEPVWTFNSHSILWQGIIL